MANVIAYIDGFNLYYRALRRGEHKWLDLGKLIAGLLPNDHVREIKYFTAMIKPSTIDPRKHVRQQVYFRALRTIPQLKIVYGNYILSRARFPLYDDWTRGIKTLVSVARMEEKGSDVNLASHMIWDGVNGRYDVAALLSADSDLAEPLRIVSQELGKPIILLHPYVPSSNGTFREPTRALRQYAIGIKKIREGLLESCQLPHSLSDNDGDFSRPPEWK